MNSSISLPTGPRNTFILLMMVNTLGCTFTEQIRTPILPPALIEPLPINVGVYFDEKFKNYRYVAPIDPREESVKVEIIFGSSNVDLFRDVFTKSFENIATVDRWPYSKSNESSFDALIRPTIVELRSRADLYKRGSSGAVIVIEDEFKSGGPPVFSYISYKFEFVESNGTPILSWVISDTATAGPPTFDGSVSSLQARVLEEQMRLIAAKFLTEFPLQPKVRDWLKSKESE